MLSVLVFFSACFLIHLAVTSPSGNVVGGWSLNAAQLHVGFARVLYPFFAGVLLFRVARLTQIKNTFLWCSLLIIIILAMHRIGGSGHLWLNGVYESICIILIFPLVVYMAASGTVEGKYATRLCKFFGDISYPVYITHYPLIYIYTGWISDTKVTLQHAWLVALLVYVSAILIAYISLKLYDEPVRRWLSRKLLA